VRRWQAASLVVVAALFAGVTGEWALSCGVAALTVVALALGSRFALPPFGARIAASLAAAAGAGIGWLLPMAAEHGLRAPWPSFALAGLLSGAALLWRRQPERGAALGLLPGLAALTACGEAPVGRVYGVVAVVHVALALLGLRAGRGGEMPRLREIPRARIVAGGLVVAFATALTAGLALALPPLSIWTETRILHALGVDQVGFGDRMWLGSLHGLLQSDEIVMRVDGARVDYLRGAVYDHYENGRWGRRVPARPMPLAAPPPVASDGVATRARVTSVGGSRERFFVPLGARAVATDPVGSVDAFAVVRAVGGSAREVSFDAPKDRAPDGAADADDGARGPALAVADPAEVDLDVPPSLRPALGRIAALWTEGATTQEQKALAIAARLRADYTYALKFDHRRRRDPLLDFLLDDHRGHCEYFASAMTLLARAAGVPARVAAGYRVAEENPLGHYWVVRERNAHAWSEVFLPGRGFVTIDATPAGAVAENEPHRSGLIGAVWDVVRAAVGRAFAAVTVLHVGGSLALVVVVGLVARQLRQRRAPKATAARASAYLRPPPSLARLLDALARRGAVRPAWEPLERFADRLDEPAFAEAADLLRRWAAHRYGGVGAEDQLVRDLSRCAERLRR
jgi:transglutaminase-like putative cysteine protease